MAAAGRHIKKVKEKRGRRKAEKLGRDKSVSFKATGP